MEKLNYSNLEDISGGDAIDSFCKGFGAAASVYGVGIYANLWNPVGISAGIAAALIGGACVAREL